MALTGDVIIKFAADFAEFSTGMVEAGKKLEEYGEHAKKTGDSITNFIGTIKKAFAALGVEEAIRRLIDYGEQLQKSVAEISTQASTLGTTTDAFQAYQLAAIDAGQKTEAITQLIGKFNTSIGQAAQGSKTQIDALNQLGVKILDANGQLRSQSDILTEVARKLLEVPEGAKRAAIEIALFGKAGQEINPMLETLSNSVSSLQGKFRNEIIPKSVIDRMDELEKRGALAQKRIEAFVAPIYGEAKNWLITKVADVIERLALAINSVSLGNLEKIARLMLAFSTGTIGVVVADSLKGTVEEQLADRVKQAQDRVATLQSILPQAGSERESKRIQKELADERAAVLAAEAALDRYHAKQRGDSQETGGQPEGTPITKTGQRQPVPTAVGEAADNFNARITQLAEREKAARAAIAELDQLRPGDIEQQVKDIELRKKQADELANLERVAKKAGVTLTDTQRQQLRNTIAQEDAQARLTKTVQQAQATEDKYGDGKAALGKVQGDLDRQLRAHLITQQTYNRALKAGQEQTELNALAARRYDDDLGALAAGFESAAKQYARANDMFSVGGQLFSATTNAMSEGLDVLLGKSNKTFGQIAADFASMLSKMAMQAAVSQVFKAIFGAISGDVSFAAGSSWGGVMDIGQGPTAFPLTGRAGGGPVTAGMPYWVGEAGPERFVPQTAGTIVPYGSGGGNNVTVNVAMQAASQPSAAQASAFARKVQQAVLDTINNEKRPGGSLHAAAMR